MNLVSFLFGFSGRINRLQYWLGCIGAGFGGGMLFMLLGLLTMPVGGMPKSGDAALQALASMGLSLGVPLFLIGWIATALQTKRFHDRGRSGLWVLLPFVPATMMVTTIVSGAATGASFEHVFSSMGVWFLLLQLVNLFMFVDLGCMPGKAGPNKYGNPPGGGFSGGAPLAPVRGQPASAKALAIPGMAPKQTAPAVGSTLASAESAIDRAIAAQAKAAASASARSTPSANGVRPAAPGTFGRKVTQ